jgi:hypothetical protein
MCLWVVPLAIRSAVIRCCASNLALGLALLLAAAFAPVLQGQSTLGTVEGTLRARDGQFLSGSPVVVTGGAGFRTTVHTNSRGEFTLTLPYGRYRFEGGREVSGVSVFVEPFGTTRLELVDGGPAVSRTLEAAGLWLGLWSDRTRGRTYPEAFSLHGVLLSREPASVTEPLDFVGLSDQRLAVASQRAFSWTATEYRFQGIDATDSYQPGRPLVLPNIEVMEAIAVRGAFAQAAPASYGTEVGLFLAEPGARWHGAVASSNTGAGLAASNLPPPASRGLVEQADEFRWFTRDGVEAGGPLGKWADFFASATGQWSSQNVPLAAPGSEQRSRLLFANARGRVQAGAWGQLEGAYSGSRIDLSDWGNPAGLEAYAGNRMAPSFVLPVGFSGESEVDHMDFVEAGWTRRAGSGAIQLRYGYSTAHLDTQQTGHGAGPQQSRIELLGGAVTGAPPVGNFAVRTRHSMAGLWQPGPLGSGAIRHRLVAGGGWKVSNPRNRFAIPGDMNLITASGVPAFVVRFNAPGDTRASVRSFSGYVADRLNLTRAVTLDLGARADFSRGSVRGQPGDLIVWNSLSPRAGFAWSVPHAHGLVLRGAYSRLYAPLAGRYLDFGDPNSLGGSEYAWIDGNSDGWFQPGEQGTLVARFGGPYSSILPSLRRPYADGIDVGAEIAVTHRTVAGIHLFRRDEKDRIAAADVGVPGQAFSPVVIADAGPDGIAGTFDDRELAVYQQNPATFGQDGYVLTNPPGLRMLNAGLLTEVRTAWRGLMLDASFVAEKAYGPTNPGDAPFENDPGVTGALALDPNSGIHATGRTFVDRAYVGKTQAVYRLPWSGIELAAVANYMDGLVFGRRLLVTGLAQGPLVVASTVRGSPEGGHRAEYVINWNLRARREVRLPIGRLAAWADVLNVTNAGQRIQESDLSGPAFNLRLPVAIQAPRTVRLGFRYEY